MYNDKELFDDGGLNWYDYGFRNYDPQIGRFTQLDPLTDDYPELSNYQYASNEPIANVDMDGLEKATAIMDFTYDFASKSSFVFPAATKVVSNAAEKAAVKVGEGIIKQALKKSFTFFGIASKATNLAILLLTPLNAGVPDEMRGVQQMQLALQRQKESASPNGDVDESDKDDIFLYRGGSFTDVNFTPKEDDTKPGPKQGWSTFTDPLKATQGQGENTKY